MQIEGTVAVVTGAASGLGEATARRLHANGAEVVIADMNDERGEAVAADLGDRAEYVRCDVTAPETVRRGDRAGNRAWSASESPSTAPAAASQPARSARDGTPHDLDAFRQVIELNLVGHVQRVAPHLVGDVGERTGRAVANAACASRPRRSPGYEGQIGQIAYGSAKAGVIGMTIIAARDLAAVGVRVCTIAPGTFGTPPMMGVPEAMRDAFAAGRAVPEAAGRARGVRGTRPAHRRERLLERRGHPARRRGALPTEVAIRGTRR